MAARAAARAVLAKAIKAPKAARAPRAPSAYNLFVADKSKSPEFAGRSMSEIMKSLGSRWQQAPEFEKAPYKTEAATKKAALPAQPTPDAAAFSPGNIRLKDEAALEALVAKVADAAVKGMMSELQCAAAGTEEKVFDLPKGVGTVRVAVRDRKKPISLTYKPSDTRTYKAA